MQQDTAGNLNAECVAYERHSEAVSDPETELPADLRHVVQIGHFRTSSFRHSARSQGT